MKCELEEKKKIPLSKRAGKWMAGFFVLMIALTVLSRTASAMTIPRVTLEKPKNQFIDLMIEGNGTLIDQSKHYVSVETGRKVKLAEKKEGDSVKKGDVLFVYDLEELKEKLEEKKKELEKELDKVSLQRRKDALNDQKKEVDSSIQKAELQVERAMFKIEEAKEDCRKAEKEYEKVLEEIKEKKTEAGEEEEEKKQKVYEEAVEQLQEVKESNEELLRTAARKVSDMEIELKKSMTKDPKLLDELEAYEIAVKINSLVAKLDLEQNIFELFYGRDGYQKHKQEITKAKTSLERQKNDLPILEERWRLNLISAREALDQAKGDTAYESALNQYKLQKLNRDSEIENAQRAIADAKIGLEDLERKDGEIRTALAQYETNYVFSEAAKMQAYRNLCKALNFSEEKDEGSILDAERSLERAKEDFKLEEEKCEKLLEKKEKAVEEAKKEQEEKGKPYDGKEEKEAAKQKIEAAEEILEQAYQALEDAQSGKNEAQEQQAVKEYNNEIEKEIKELEMESSSLDRMNLEEEIRELQEKIYLDGKVISPVNGTILKFEITERKSTSGEELVILGTEDYVFQGNLSEEEKKLVKKGDTIFLEIGEKKKRAESKILSFGEKTEEGKIKFTALLPENGEYEAEEATFVIAKKTTEKGLCVPVSALKSDQKGSYVLIVREEENIMGKEIIAVRVEVKVQDQNSELALVSGTLNPDDQIITSYSKPVEAGDLVRIQEKEVS